MFAVVGACRLVFWLLLFVVCCSVLFGDVVCCWSLFEFVLVCLIVVACHYCRCCLFVVVVCCLFVFVACV